MPVMTLAFWIGLVAMFMLDPCLDVWELMCARFEDTGGELDYGCNKKVK